MKFDTGFTNRIRSRTDSFMNMITGFGTSRDHGEQFSWHSESIMDTNKLDDIYAQHPIAWKLIDPVVDSAIHNWISIDSDKEEDINDRILEMGGQEVIVRALKMARQHGGCAIFLDIDDNAPDDMPIDYNSATELKSIYLIERNYCNPQYLNRTLNPEHYNVTTSAYSKTPISLRRVHYSRLIILRGIEVSTDWMLRNSGWGESIIQRCIKPLTNYSIAHGTVPNILKDFIRDVIKVDGLTELAVMNDEKSRDAFRDRMEYMFQGQSMINKLVLDKEDDYERSTSSVGGLDDLIRATENALVAASGLPHTLILGESPGSSLGEGGQGQDKDFIKVVNSFQWAKVRPVLDQLFNVMSKIDGYDRVKYTFNPVQMSTKLEEAKTLDTVASALQKLVPMILSPKEGASMFVDATIKTIPKLDNISRDRMTQALNKPDDNEGDNNVSDRN